MKLDRFFFLCGNSHTSSMTRNVSLLLGRLPALYYLVIWLPASFSLAYYPAALSEVFNSQTYQQTVMTPDRAQLVKTQDRWMQLGTIRLSSRQCCSPSTLTVMGFSNNNPCHCRVKSKGSGELVRKVSLRSPACFVSAMNASPFPPLQCNAGERRIERNVT